jgi:hypothetical protein
MRGGHTEENQPVTEREVGTESMLGLQRLEQSFEFVNSFIEASKKLKIKYHNCKLFKISENHQRTYKKVLIYSFKVLQKYIHLVTQSF